MSEFNSDKGPDASQDDPLTGALDRWANGVEGYRPLDTEVLATLSQPGRRRTTFGWKAAATLAAAAMFLFAMAQVSFTVSLGDASLQWGTIATGDVEELSTQLTNAETRIALFENQLITHAEAINTVAAQNALLGESLQATAFELAQRQELESAARVYDMQHLAEFVAYQEQGD